MRGSKIIYKTRPLALTCAGDPQQIPAVVTHHILASSTKQSRVLVALSLEFARASRLDV